ncbi:ATP-dependent DNA helicase [Mycena chlorophos]|uniref:ATP-dependent DNA helicase n=1 Tax=Mycena chlorophos TaxID=658473 RepID=A0A8H6WIX8_MYCCL|nr:ATP-dependent DNA helicase [Mycena chlorophos]
MSTETGTENSLLQAIAQFTIPEIIQLLNGVVSLSRTDKRRRSRLVLVLQQLNEQQQAVVRLKMAGNRGSKKQRLNDGSSRLVIEVPYRGTEDVGDGGLPVHVGGVQELVSGPFLQVPSPARYRRVYKPQRRRGKWCAWSAHVACFNDKLLLANPQSIPNLFLLAPTHPHPAHELFNGALLHGPALRADGGRYLCLECRSQLLINERPRLSLANNMWLGEAPFELLDLGLAERLLIGLYFPAVSIPACGGNVSTYRLASNQVSAMVTDNLLPHSSRVLSATIGVTFVGFKKLPLRILPQLFDVRRHRVRDALCWLKANNPFYHDIQISEQRLAALPVAGVPQEIALNVRYEDDPSLIQREQGSYVPDDAQRPAGVALSAAMDNETATSEEQTTNSVSSAMQEDIVLLAPAPETPGQQTTNVGGTNQRLWASVHEWERHGLCVMKEALKSEDFRLKMKAFISANICAHIEGTTADSLKSLPTSKNLGYSRPPDPRQPNYDARAAELERNVARSYQWHDCLPYTCLRPKAGRMVCKRRAPWPTADEAWVMENGEWGPKRLHGLMNAWNPALLQVTRCNQDMKIITNGAETKDITFYITLYIAKRQIQAANASALLAKAYAYKPRRTPDQREIQDINRQMLERCVNILNRQHEFSAPEVISYLMGWGDRFISHTYVRIYWDVITAQLRRTFPHLRGATFGTGLLSTMVAEVIEQEQEQPIRLTRDEQGFLVLRDQLREYRDRGLALEDMNFFDYFTDTYDGKMLIANSNEEDDDEDAATVGEKRKRAGRPASQRVPYLPGSGRKRCRVVRGAKQEVNLHFVGKWFPRNDVPGEREYYCAQMLLLFKPWRRLGDLASGYSSFDEAFQLFISTASTNCLRILDNLQYFYDCSDQARKRREAAQVSERQQECTVPVDDTQDRPVAMEIEFQEEDVRLARSLRYAAREEIYGEGAMATAFAQGIFSNSYGEVPLNAVARQATAADMSQYHEWGQRIAAYTRSAMFAENNGLVVGGPQVDAAVFQDEGQPEINTVSESEPAVEALDCEPTPEGGKERSLITLDTRRPHGQPRQPPRLEREPYSDIADYLRMSAEDRERSILTLLLEINGRTHAAEAGQLQLAENLGRAEVAMGDMRLQLDNADALVITLQNQQGAGKAASGGKQPRVAAPDFNGDATTVDSFLADCFLNFNGNPLYAGDTAKINYALSYCKEGPAVVWKDTIVQSMRNGTGTGSFKTWKDFEDGFIATFRSPAHVELTIQKMETLRQGKGEPAMNYFTLLDSYNQVAKYDDTNLTRLLRRALDPRIIKGIYGQSTQPVTYDQWKRDALKHDGLLQEWAAGNRAANPAVAKNNPVRTNTWNRAPTTATTGAVVPAGNLAPAQPAVAVQAPVPMEVDRAAANEHQTREVICYRCGLEGHIGRNCTTPAAQWVRGQVAEPKEDPAPEGGADFQAARG